MSVSIRSPTITVVSECASMRLSAERIISGLGLPTKYGSTPVALVISAATDPVAGIGPCWLGPGDVGVGRDEPRALVDEPDRGGDGLEGVGPGLAEHDVLRVPLGHHVADLVQGGGQPGLADDVRRTPGALVVEELRGRERAGPDRVLGYVDPGPVQPRLQVTRGEDRVVRQQQERPAGLDEPGHELRRPGDRAPPRGRARRPCRRATHGRGAARRDRSYRPCCHDPGRARRRRLAPVLGSGSTRCTAVIAMPVNATASSRTWTALPTRPSLSPTRIMHARRPAARPAPSG